MARHRGFCALVCLVGGGQEIHSGEGGLAEWGDALRQAELGGIAWRMRAAPDLLQMTDPRQRLGTLTGLQTIAALHLDVPLRQIRNPTAAAWVDLILAGNANAAWAMAKNAGEVPFLLTRDPMPMRSWLRTHARGLRRAGLLASSGAARLRAEGFGAELPHMDARAVYHWFLDRFPEDVRASDALEVLATEFSCQGSSWTMSAYAGTPTSSASLAAPAGKCAISKAKIGKSVINRRGSQTRLTPIASC